MRDKYTDMLRVGKVSSINPERGTAQVTFEDRNDIVTADLQILVPTTLADKFYYMPAIGERVECLFNPESPSTGRIIGSYYADTRMPPIGDANKIYIRFSDGGHIEYDKGASVLTINVPGDINVTASGHITVNAPRVSINTGG